jgi:hypothetical protein
MQLQKYLNAKYGIDAIIKSSLKVSIPTELNDPFEFLPKEIGKWTVHKVKRYLKDKARQNRIYNYQKQQGIVKNKHQFKEALKDRDSIAESLVGKFQSREYWEYIQSSKQDSNQYMRLISFSSDTAKEHDQILMWSHYSDNHSGIRLHYDSDLIMLSSFELRRINYSIDRPPVDHTLDDKSNELVIQLMNAMTTKSICWQYEQEYRIFVDPLYCSKQIKDDKELYFAKIPERSLIRVDLGLNADKKILEDIKSLQKINRFKNVRFYKAELNKEQYKLDYSIIN